MGVGGARMTAKHPAPKLASGRSARWAFMERFEVPNLDDPRQTYLTRWRLIKSPWIGFYLHRMDGPDSRSTLHDHPELTGVVFGVTLFVIVAAFG